MGIEYKYNAFISYRHISPDKEIAEKLQKKLENYKPPKSLAKGKRSGGWRVFRDETELPTSSNLSDDIRVALEKSEYLIVICSKTTKDSKWCMEEVEYFKKLHNGNNANIITLIADGNPEDVFPPILCNELIPVTDDEGNTTYQNHVIEPLAANVAAKTQKESLKKLNTEFLRIAAPILGCGYDNLYNREHRKKIRRILTIGGIVLSLLLLFAVYNSAMLWKINNQKIALAAANEDLQQKTEELNLSNENLIKSNEELAKKTKEAEDNLAEANKQKKAAEDNLAEAERQRRIAETNLAEANRQKKIAEDNLAEANRQQAIAEANAQEAQTQKGIAEENMRVAQENEAKAIEANKNLRIKNSEILATQAEMHLKNDDYYAAINTALEAMPEADENIPDNILAEYVLAEATGLYKNDSKMLCNRIKLSGYVDFLEFSEDGQNILASDNTGNIYVIDYDKNKVVKSYSPLETFGDTMGYIKDICIAGNNGYVLCDDQLLSINMVDGTTQWKYTPDKYISFEEIVTNKDANSIFMSGYSNYIILDKSGKILSALDQTKSEYDKGFYSNTFMASNGDVFVFDSEKSEMTVINQFSLNKIPFDIHKGNEVLSFGENDSCVFVNVGLDGALTYNKAKVMCINKKNLNTLWQTEYEVESISTLYCNKIFDFTHRLVKKDNGYDEKNGVLVVSGCEVMCFDKSNGELYYHNTCEYNDRILYCEKNDTSYSLRIATPSAFYPECYLVTPESGLSEDDTFFLHGGYTFDKERKYITHSAPNKFALASEKSSEISIYHNISYNSYTLLKDVPEKLKYIERITDNKNGIFASFHTEYIDQDKTEKTITIYDTNNQCLLSDFITDINVNEMRFVGERLFVVDNQGLSAVYDTNGKLLAKANLEELFRESANISHNKYITMSFPYLAISDTSVLYCCSDGIFVVDVSGEKIKVNHIFVGSTLNNFYAKDNLISFVKSDYTSSTSVIAYFKTSDAKLSYVKENGAEKSFVKDSITSVINAGDLGFVAFVSQEGYIGISEYGSDSFKKISLNKGETVPLKIALSPDRKNILALCSNGEIVKYSVETLSKVGSYQLSIDVDANSILEFIDDNNFIVREYSRSERVIIVDSNSMQLRADVDGIIHFMKNDKRLIFKKYGDDAKYFFGYYKYKTGQELATFAKEFMQMYAN